MKRYIFLTLATMALFACQKQELETYNGGRYLAFYSLDAKETDPYEDSTFISFSYYPDSNELEIKTEVRLISGELPQQNLTYNIEVIDSLTTAPKANYSISKTQTYKAGAVKDYTVIKLLRTDDLKEDISVVIAIVPGGDIMGGMFGRHMHKVTFNNILSQPEWWTKTITNTYLGTYSPKKYTEFMRYTGIIDFGVLTSSMKRYWALRFKDDIIKYNLTEDEEGKIPMVVTIY